MQLLSRGVRIGDVQCPRGEDVVARLIARLDVSPDPDEVTAPEDVEEVLRDVRAFLDDPIALLERAVAVLKTQRAPALVV